MRLVDLGPNQCRFAVTDEPPRQVALCADMPFAEHRFCGAKTAEGEPYCPPHKAICHAGTGRDWELLEQMIRAIEQSVTFVSLLDEVIE